MGKEILGNDGVLDRSKPFPIVAIGASAGGLEAVSVILQHLPEDTGMAFVYIQHLDPTHESNLASILQRLTKMKVLETSNKTAIRKNHLYIIPPNASLTIVEDAFEITKRVARPAKTSPIDDFFISLAKNQKEGSIGIILSGMASDGALGLKAIKVAGGITFAQDDSAAFLSMPKSAIAEGAVDAVLSPKQIAEELVRLSRKPELLETALLPETLEDDEDTKHVENDIPLINPQEVNVILQIVKTKTSADFTNYKQTTIRRRIVRRMLLHKLEDLRQYIDYLKKDANEPVLLFHDLLINVTRFFRDVESMEHLQKEILPKIFDKSNPNKRIRIWVPACSTGEESYSIAMLIIEALGPTITNVPVQIFSTDLSEPAIAKARSGLYTLADLAEVSPERLKRFFVKMDGHYRVIKQIRDLCVFSPHNVFKDPPFSKVDIISCCNLLIYFNTTLQKKVFSNFHYALNDGGYLVLGRSETVGASADLFLLADKKLKIYSKRSEADSRITFQLNYNLSTSERKDAGAVKKAVKEERPAGPSQLENIIDYIFLEKYCPAGVVVTYDLEIVHFRGSTNRFIRPAQGKASLNLLKMMRSELATEVSEATRKVIESGEVVRGENADSEFAFEITPLDMHTEEKLLLIVFEDLKVSKHYEPAGQPTNKKAKLLEGELLRVKKEMRTIVESQEAANEELQSANEEIVSSNEELQSINEELETSKEELESGNEELMTINQELQVRNDQLSQSQEYTEAVIETIREAVIVLDYNLRVKVANKAFYRMFNCNEKDTEAKLIFELSKGKFNILRLREFLQEILPEHNQYTGFEIKHFFEGIGEKVLLLSAKKLKENVQGRIYTLIAFEDITEHKIAERLLEEREAWLRNMTNNVPVMIWVAGTDKNFSYLNKTWLAFTGKSLTKETGIGWTEGIHREDIEKVLTAYHSCYQQQTPLSIEYRMKRHDGQYRWVLNSAVPTFDAQGQFTGYTGTCTEIHDKLVLQIEMEKLVEERTAELQIANANLIRTNDELKQFAYVASHDLQEPLRKIITFTNRFKEKYEDTVPEKGMENLDKIASSAHRMRHLIYDLLNFSKISSYENSFVITDFNDALKDVLADFELLIQEKGAEINAEQLPSILAIPLQIKQLFHNLISNALKFSVTDPVISITSKHMAADEVRTRHFAPGLKYVEIIFKDNGIGFNQDFADQIFVIFQRLNNKEQFPGTGIGLALCKKIALNHKGDIYAIGKESEGAEFHLILPDRQQYE